MSMSTHVVGFRPADEYWNRMKAVWDACRAADIAVPDEVALFFGDVYPGNSPGMCIPIQDAVTPYNGGSEQGFDVDIDKLPAGLRVIRFYNSW